MQNSVFFAAMIRDHFTSKDMFMADAFLANEVITAKWKEEKKARLAVFKDGK